MAKYKYLLTETGDARFLNRFVEPGEVVEIPDDVALQYEFSPEVWQEITPAKKAAARKAAKKRAPRKKAAAKKAAAPTAPPEPVTDTTVSDVNQNDEE